MRKITIIGILIVSLFVLSGCNPKEPKMKYHENPPRLEDIQQQENVNSHF